MAALSEADMIACLGANYREAEKAFDAVNKDRAERRELMKKVQSSDDNKFNALFTVLTGAVLVASAFYRATGMEFNIQTSIGVLFILVGAWWYVYLNGAIAKSSVRLAQLTEIN